MSSAISQVEGGKAQLHTSGSVVAPQGLHVAKSKKPSPPLTGQMQREWLRSVITETGIKPTPLAAMAGVATSTLTRFLEEDADNPHALHPTTIEKVARATGIAPPAVASAPSKRFVRGFRDDGVKFDAADHPEGIAIEIALKALKAGRNNAEAWTLRSRSLEAAGYFPGDVVLVDHGRHPQPGDIVCAQVYDHSGEAKETAFRFYEPPSLVALSYDPAFRKPMMLDPERVVVMGVVTNLIRNVKAVA